MNTRHLLIALAAIALSIRGATAAEPILGKAADNHIHAQSLVDQQVAKPENADLAILGLHAVAPGASEQTMIACNLDRIGKADTDEDKVVSRLHKTILFQKLSDPEIFEVLIPLHDSGGNVIGMAVFVYKGFQTGSDETPYYLRSVKMRDEIARHTPAGTGLFQASR